MIFLKCQSDYIIACWTTSQCAWGKKYKSQISALCVVWSSSPPPSADLLPHIGPFRSFSLARECPLQHCTSASSVLPTSHPPTLGQPTGFSFPDISVLNFSWSPYNSLSYNHIFFLQNSYYNLQASIILYFYFLNVCFLHYTVSSTKAKNHYCFVLFYLSLSILAPSTWWAFDLIIYCWNNE